MTVPALKQPVSALIRARLDAARKRFHANDNIADFIEPGELEALLDEVAGKMQGVLDSLVLIPRATTIPRTLRAASPRCM